MKPVPARSPDEGKGFAAVADEHTRAVLARVEVDYDPREQEEILAVFTDMLRAVIADGGRKRAAGSKRPWTIDPEHAAALRRHLARYEMGERKDPDSKAHPLVHAAARCLMLAWQEGR